MIYDYICNILLYMFPSVLTGHRSLPSEVATDARDGRNRYLRHGFFSGLHCWETRGTSTGVMEVDASDQVFFLG